MSFCRDLLSQINVILQNKARKTNFQKLAYNGNWIIKTNIFSYSLRFFCLKCAYYIAVKKLKNTENE